MSISLSRYQFSPTREVSSSLYLANKPLALAIVVALVMTSFWHVYLQHQSYAIGNQLSVLRTQEASMIFQNQVVQERINQQLNSGPQGLIAPSPQRVIHLKEANS
jgi:type II secretory pathway component PulC